MSHVPCGLAGGTPGPVGACWAIVKVVPTRVSTSGSKRAISILIFIVILSGIGLGVPIRHGLASILVAEFFQIFCLDYVYHLILISLHLAQLSGAVNFTDI
jgi:hypothetical protein